MKLPKFFGLDIGKTTTKIAQVEQRGEGVELKKLFKFESLGVGIATEDPAQRSELAVRLKEAVAGAKLDTRKCVLALPEPAVFNRLMVFPAMSEQELTEAIHWNAKQFIPIPVADVEKDWIKVADLVIDGKKMVQVLVVAAPKKLVNQAKELCAEADLELIALETESVATSRVISNAYQQQVPLLVLDVGASGTDLSVVDRGNLIFSQSLATGSEALTRALAATFNLDSAQAEQYKTRYGLLPNEGEGKVFKALEPVMQVVVSELSKTLTFFRTKYQQSAPQKVLVVGEGAKIPGIAAYLQQSLQLPVELADMSQNLIPAADLDWDLKQGITEFAVALGLALKTK